VKNAYRADLLEVDAAAWDRRLNRKSSAQFGFLQENVARE
jgi:hypothetical protein